MKREKIIFGLFGAGGFAREMMPVVKERLESLFPTSSHAEISAFFVEQKPAEQLVNGVPLISEEAFFSIECDIRYFNIAIADSKLREKLATLCLKKGAVPFSLQSQNAILYNETEIGPGAILCAFSSVTANTKIGQFFHNNFYCYVAHDCIIGDYVTFAPRAQCNGNVIIGNHAYIGACAVIKQGSKENPLTIGEGAIIGMGAVVTKSVAPYTTVIGNPARLMEKK